MVISNQVIKKAVKEALAEEAKDNADAIQPIIIPPLSKQSTQINASVQTQDVIDSFLLHKKHEAAGDETKRTYGKRLNLFANQFPVLPLETKALIDYLAQFNGETGRHKRNHQDLLNALYKHALLYFDVSQNPLENLKRPKVIKKPIKTLSLEEACKVDSVVCIIAERAVWQLTFGHGWRQIEVRRITAGDVRKISDGIIWCRGKERDEFTPILPETQLLLEHLADGLEDDEHVIRSTRIRAGRTQPLGEDGMRQLIQRFLDRSGIIYKGKYKGHDLRRTFCTLVREARDDEFLAMRLARDIISGVNDRYININLAKLRESLLKYSPLRQIKLMQTGESLVETGESRTPRPREATQNILQA